MDYLIKETLPFKFCPGCSHGIILKRLDEALKTLNLPPNKVVIVSDIGCVGLSDHHFATNTFHGQHGRSITYATGIKLANPGLAVIVLIGDGGCGIGGHHLINAARRNVDLTVLVFNNFNFGMTGGEHSVTTPPDSFTTSTPAGCIERPMDICATVAVNGASFVARATAFEDSLGGIIAEAISCKGLSLLDIWEFCTAYYVSRNPINRKSFIVLSDKLNMPMGIIKKTPHRERAVPPTDRQSFITPQKEAPGGLIRKYHNNLKEKVRIILAGSAGQKVRSAASIFSRAAILSGLYAAQKDDYPITIMTGYSVAEIILHSKPILYTGIEVPDLVIIISRDGLNRIRDRLKPIKDETMIFIDDALRDQLDIEFRNSIYRLPVQDWVEAKEVGRKNLALVALGYVLNKNQLFPIDALKDAIISSAPTNIADENLKALNYWERLAIEG